MYREEWEKMRHFLQKVRKQILFVTKTKTSMYRIQDATLYYVPKLYRNILSKNNFEIKEIVSFNCVPYLFINKKGIVLKKSMIKHK